MSLHTANDNGQSGIEARPLLEVTDLDVVFRLEDAEIQAVRGVDFSISQGEVVALVGESGSGKSTIGLALMRLLEGESGLTLNGSTQFRSEIWPEINLMTCTANQMRKIRGNEIAMIFQEPMSSLNPVFRVGDQIVEAIRVHEAINRSEAAARALAMLTLLGIPNPAQCLKSYPHEISGGMRQRAMIAMALACEPSLLIADEPTTALDVTIQAQIIDHLKRLQEQSGMSILFITHDLGLVAEIADRVLVLYAGQIVELSDVEPLFDQPLMPYTGALMRSIPRPGCSSIPGYRIEAIPGTVPNAAALPHGCAFHPRCQFARSTVCDAQNPVLETYKSGRMVRCFRWEELREEGAI